MLRTRIVLGTVAALISLRCAHPSIAGEASHVRWFNNVNEAWRASQSQDRPLLVFVTRSDCLPCAKMKVGTYTDPAVAAAINDRFVPLAIDATLPSQLLKDLAVIGYPATFVISPQAVILQRMDGYVSAAQMTAKLAHVGPATPGKVPARPVSGQAF